MSEQSRFNLGLRMSDFSSQYIPERRKKRKSLISQVGRSLDMMGGFKNLFPQGNKVACQAAEKKKSLG